MADQGNGRNAITGPRLVVHIGPHKTGSTYLQENFTRQAAELRKRGWLYPAIGERVSIAHHDFSDARKQCQAGAGATYDDFRRVLAKADQQGLNLLLSSEGFQKWRPAHFAALKKAADDRPLQLVYMLRDPLDKFYSLWAQLVRSGLTRSLPERMAEHFSDPQNSRLLNPLVEIQPVFEDKSFDYTVLLYDELRRQNRDIYAFFLEAVLGIEDLPPPPNQSSNERLPIEMTEFIRLLSLESGYRRGREQRGVLNIGSVIKFVFKDRQRQEIVETMDRFGAPARRTIEILRTTPEYLGLQEKMVALLGANMLPPPPADGLFSREPTRWAHYDAAVLKEIPEVQGALAKAMHKLRPNNPVLAAANFGKRLVRQWRTLRKSIWLGAAAALPDRDNAPSDKAARRRERRGAGKGAAQSSK
jgi:hypothetical protein